LTYVNACGCKETRRAYVCGDLGDEERIAVADDQTLKSSKGWSGGKLDRADSFSGHTKNLPWW
jgi:hypothetical protein